MPPKHTIMQIIDMRLVTNFNSHMLTNLPDSYLILRNKKNLWKIQEKERQSIAEATQTVPYADK